MQKELDIGEDLQERSPHGDDSFPFEISNYVLSKFNNAALENHWHIQPEFIYIIKGQMEYRVNEAVFHLVRGSGIFTNATSLHAANRIAGHDCKFISLIFDPILVFGQENSLIQRKYVSELLTSKEIPCLFFDPAIEWQAAILGLLTDLNQLYKKKADGFELLIKARLCELWAILYTNTKNHLAGSSPQNAKDVLRLKTILEFLHENYGERITLNEIAAKANISSSECSRFFKRMMRQSPFDYLLTYRIHRSLPMLISGERNITEIAEQVGFSNPSYFTEVFRRIMKSSPSEYKKQSEVNSAQLINEDPT
jgi:AraC-like DNA-binding protein